MFLKSLNTGKVVLWEKRSMEFKVGKELHVYTDHAFPLTLEHRWQVKKLISSSVRWSKIHQLL